MDRKFLRPKEVEDIYSIDAGTLANWRCQGRGPAYVKYGRKVLYPIQSLDDWCLNHQVRTV
ncbi:MAG: helix-turn-helix domain-containing protein, partial [Desulfobacteraceae bacterium]|nr:helix-turn-helix domain-containing protein [Desulfobacteraceae bacterium]